MAMLFTLLLGFASVILFFYINRIDASLHDLQWVSYLILFLMFLVVITSFGISYFVISRINRIAKIAEEIVQTGDLTRRVLIDSQWDDLSYLSAVLNNFLDRIESSMQSVREVSNNIAHDLRTPLTSLRNNIEGLRNKDIQPHEIEDLLGETDRILALFQALLRIVNIEKGKRHSAFHIVDLKQVLQDVAELYEPAAEEKNIRLSLHANIVAPIKGDRDLLFQLLTNLLENAIKFSPNGSEIRCALISRSGNYEIIITDNGIGISDAEKLHVFKHFYRSDSSRHLEGHGLGLSLVKAIVELHHGQVLLENAHPGLCVRLKFKTLPIV